MSSDAGRGHLRVIYRLAGVISASRGHIKVKTCNTLDRHTVNSSANEGHLSTDRGQMLVEVRCE